MIAATRKRLLALLARETSGGNLIPEIDGVRFLAILAVIFFHLWGNFATYASTRAPIPASFKIPAKILAQGELGVELFFVISGFILALPFAKYWMGGARRISLASYFKRRVVRLEPPYIANLLILYVLLVVATHHNLGFSYLFTHLAASAVYMHNIVFGGPSIINTVAWSLEIEIQFYILAPLLACVFTINSLAVRRTLLLSSIFVGSLASEFLIGSGRLHLSIVNYIQYFLCGFMLVDLYLADWKGFPLQTRWFDLVAVAAIALLFTIGPITGMRALFVPWLVLFIVMAAFRGSFTRCIFRNPWIYTIGGMCYTIYLYHFAVIGVLGHGRLLITPYFWCNLALTFVLVPLAILAASSMLFMLLEKPFMRRDWHLHLWNRTFGKRS